ncbi:maf family bZIP transcription factor traffic jam [Lycorma delicatula]|uniref:maf family bZIP transcription factor traffic jam n=1 Tax=Lycorma delicatula TaxID=130591 RepID=UPI003F516796
MMSSLESEEQHHLADEYVQQFVLDHFEDVSVKREHDIQRQSQAQERLPSMPLTSGGVMVQSPPHHLLTPPSHQTDEYNAVTMGPTSGHHHAGVVVRPTAVLCPGTPPDTPPESSSPHLNPSPPPQQQYFQLDPQQHPHIHQRTGIMDEMAWLAQNVRLEQPQPLDLRPNCTGEIGEVQDWSVMTHPSVIAGGKRIHPQEYMHHQELTPISPLGLSRPMSVSSSSAMSPMNSTSSRSNQHSAEDIIDDKLLMCLSVRELNKRLHGYPREDVVRLKQKRRTLKNRGYAQNCRSKRIHQKHELEQLNRTLHSEVHRLKVELNRIAQERDMFKHRLELLRGAAREGSDGVHSNPSSPEFYL